MDNLGWFDGYSVEKDAGVEKVQMVLKQHGCSVDADSQADAIEVVIRGNGPEGTKDE